MAKANNKDLIGKGLKSLLGNINNDLKQTDGTLKPQAVEMVVGVNRIPLSDIEVNPKNPRKDFDETALQELANSIKTHDIVQPITVTKLANGKYMLIAGERRFRASKLAGLATV
ncbi:MAG: ParB/RepB/Spo0J family partition protein, partial [Bacteroidetes bacterium]